MPQMRPAAEVVHAGLQLQPPNAAAGAPALGKRVAH